MANTITVTKDMLIWHDTQCGLYKTPQGHVLLEYQTGDGHWMSARQAKNWLKLDDTNSNSSLVCL